MLLSHRVDGIIGPQLSIFYAINNDKFPKQAFGTPLILSVVPGTLFLSNVTADEAKRTRLLGAVKQLIANGTIDALLEKYSL